MIIEKVASNKNKKEQEIKVKEEEPTRRSQRVRHKTVTGENFCRMINGDSIYYEDDDELNGYFCKDENEYMLSIMDSARGSSGRRKMDSARGSSGRRTEAKAEGTRSRISI